MRSICAVVAVAALLSSSSADADVSSAWNAAKANLPEATPAVVAFDVAQIVKQPAFGKLLDLLKKEERDVREAFDLIQGACGIDPTKAVDGFVVAGNPVGKDDDFVLMFQLTIDRQKASDCMASVLKKVEKKKPVNVKQNGMFTEITVGNETAYFAWVDKNVVAFNLEPDSKPRLEGSIKGKGAFSKSPVGPLLGKLDAKAAAFGAFKMNKPMGDIPFTGGYGNLTLAGTNGTATIVATTTDANSAAAMVTEMKKEVSKNQNKLPAAAKKVIQGVTFTSAGPEITIKGAANTNDVLEAFLSVFVGKRVEEKPAP